MGQTTSRQNHSIHPSETYKLSKQGLVVFYIKPHIQGEIYDTDFDVKVHQELPFPYNEFYANEYKKKATDLYWSKLVDEYKLSVVLIDGSKMFYKNPTKV